MAGKRAEFNFETTDADGVTVLKLCDARYHADSLEPLNAKFQEIEARRADGRIVVDLSAVRLFSSSALRAIRASHRRVLRRRGRIVAAGGGELVAGVLKFAPFIEHYSNVDEALAAFGGAASDETTAKD